MASRPVWGAWIEIFIMPALTGPNDRRAPYGARGLKFCLILLSALWGSRPVWGAWIEILVIIFWVCSWGSSRPVWGAWIEMDAAGYADAYGAVAPRMGRVD